MKCFEMSDPLPPPLPQTRETTEVLLIMNALNLMLMLSLVVLFSRLTYGRHAVVNIAVKHHTDIKMFSGRI